MNNDTQDTPGAHTPGPWKIDQRDSNTSARIGSAVDLQASGLVARVYGNNPQHMEANARLIAAAPETAAERDRLKAVNADLLAALESACAVAAAWDYDATLPVPAMRMYEIARAAIAKANGKP